MYLKFILTETEFRILEQEGIKKKTNFHSSNEAYIQIARKPACGRIFRELSLWLRGLDKTKDYCPCSHSDKKTILTAIKEFFNQAEVFQRGDTITVGSDKERIFLTYVEGAACPWICVQENNTDLFRTGQPFNTFGWKERKTTKTPLVDLGYDVYEIGVKNEI